MWRQGLRRLPQAFISILLIPVIAREFFASETGHEYGIGLLTKLKLLYIMVRNNFRVTSSSNFLYHLIMAGKILNIPRSANGVLVECGCYKGGSAVNLSHLAAACGRRLFLFDSFEGLPAPKAGDEGNLVLTEGQVRTYEPGAYAGSLEEVTENLRNYGALDVCEFRKGYFNETLPHFDEPVVFAYVDADLTDSVRDCLKYLWRLMLPGSFLFTDEAQHVEVASLFFETSWWAAEHDVLPPGLVGAGSGLGLLLHPGGFRSSLGYTCKIDREQLARKPG